MYVTLHLLADHLRTSPGPTLNEPVELANAEAALKRLESVFALLLITTKA